MIIANPIYENKITKQFSHPADTDDVRILTDILNHSGINPKDQTYRGRTGSLENGQCHV